ncbi:MAG: hypothetical protein ABI947_14565 [Chloroflexota bacterium]
MAFSVFCHLAVLVAMLWLAGCGAADDPVLPTLRPTFTPSLEPSATYTRVFNATATPSPQRLAVATAGPTPTFLIGVAPTRPSFTITPTLVNFAPGSLQIEYFTTDATSVKPGDKLTLFWSAKGVDKAIIYRLDSKGKREQVWNVNRAGTLDVTTRPADGSTAQFLLTIGNDQSNLEQTLSVPMGCTDVWFFDPQPDGCPTESPVISAVVQQTFERGSMIWVQAQTRIYVLFNDGQQPAWATYPDDFKDGQPESDPSFRPPSGLFQPIRGFGLVWRNRERVRDRIGWATGPEVPSDGALQGDATVDNGVMYLRAKDGNIFGLFNKGASWKLITP